MNNTCANCHHWQEPENGLGECHHRSPGISQDGNDMAVWPNTHDWQSCYDWKPKQATSADAMLAKSDVKTLTKRYLYIYTDKIFLNDISPNEEVLKQIQSGSMRVINIHRLTEARVVDDGHVWEGIDSD